MSRAIRLLGIAGSIRKASTNAGLLRAAGEIISKDHPDVEYSIADISNLPLYNQDLEQSVDGVLTFPPEVTRFREQVAAADGILFATAEYNYSISSMFTRCKPPPFTQCLRSHSHPLTLTLTLCAPCSTVEERHRLGIATNKCVGR
jgi:hypothetical protein